MLVRAFSFIVFLLQTILHPLLLILAIPAGLLAGSMPLAAGFGAGAGVLRIALHYLYSDARMTVAAMLVTLVGGAAVACVVWLINRRMHG